MHFKTYYELQESGNYHVTLKLVAPEISVTPAELWKVIGHNTSRFDKGMRVLQLHQIADLGFIDPRFWDHFTKKEQPDLETWINSLLDPEK
ncbi:hypothetical protein ACDZ28_33335 (plasmid) [Paenibacillus sp. RS8]|uniref:hypothetical protein n=1 Tax=Paenibacillus sp. RS8 TaxID=3242681 RepID=UPI0035BEDF7A